MNVIKKPPTLIELLEALRPKRVGELFGIAIYADPLLREGEYRIQATGGPAPVKEESDD